MVPSDALWAARMLLLFGAWLAAGTLRALARTQQPGTGLIPGPPRDTGPHLPPVTGAVKAASLFVTVLAEAWRRGLPAREAEPLLPAAEGCLGWLRGAAAASGAGGLVADPVRGGPSRAEVQAYVHRAAVQGANLLEAFGGPGRRSGGSGRRGCVRVHETAVAAVGLAQAATRPRPPHCWPASWTRLRGSVCGCPRYTRGRSAGRGQPCPHPMACRPAALAAAGVVHLLAGLAGCGRTCRAAPSR